MVILDSCSICRIWNMCIQLFEPPFSAVLYSICRRYDEMSDRVSETPENTDALVELQEYLKTVSVLFHLFDKSIIVLFRQQRPCSTR